jgi:linoleoyl-CoA desaturase
MGFVMALIGFNINARWIAWQLFYKRRTLNTVMAYSSNMLGANAFFWAQKHNINHHTYTNIEGIDDDIDVRPFIRIHEDQKKSWFHKYQHFYWPVIIHLNFFVLGVLQRFREIRYSQNC